jgi:Fe-Mn family superoxide dismutase
MNEELNRRTFIQSAALAAGGVWAGNLAAAEDKPDTLATLPALPYAFNALEPVIDARTMEIHHGKHHAAYVAGLNAAAAGKPYLAGKSLVAILASLPEVPDEAVRTALRNHGGGHWNHTFFWEIMTAPKTDPKDGMSRHLRQAVDEAFGSLENLQTAFADAAMKRFGSGWAWLIWKDGKLKITSTANQDNPLMKGVVPDSDLGTPVLGLDVWEHAYYLHYQNRRADYVKAWWDVVNWPLLSERFAMLLLKA